LLIDRYDSEEELQERSNNTVVTPAFGPREIMELSGSSCFNRRKEDLAPT